MKRLTLPAVVAVVLAANALVLAGVARNRMGAPEARLELTQSQLPLAASGDENSGVSVRLKWSSDSFAPDDAKLAQLGYETAHARLIRPNPVFVALECDRSRPELAVVNAGREAASLRRRYPDTGRFLITRATLYRAWRRHQGQSTNYTAVMLEAPQIHIPLPCSETLRKSPNSYTVTLTYGRNYEPWISGCRAGN